MPAIICELCGSNDIQKQDGLFVCQHCGTKYTLEEAKKLIGTVQVDNSQKIRNLFELARRARDNKNNEDAYRYYDLIRQEESSSWEANFFAVYFKAYNCTIAEIASAASSVTNCIHSTFELIEANVVDDDSRRQAVEQVCSAAFDISDMLKSAASAHYDDIDSSIRADYLSEYTRNTESADSIKAKVCDELCTVFLNDKAVFTSVGFKYLKQRIKTQYRPKNYIAAIQKYDPDFVDLDEFNKELQRQQEEQERQELLEEVQKQIQEIEKLQRKIERKERFERGIEIPVGGSSGGCYIATAVYGSYDCPEVWTLRRYRDNTLSACWYGRLFIRAYYATSPALVKLFGNKEWFNSIWKPYLDRKVKSLNEKGVSNMPYNDK